MSSDDSRLSLSCEMMEQRVYLHSAVDISQELLFSLQVILGAYFETCGLPHQWIICYMTVLMSIKIMFTHPTSHILKILTKHGDTKLKKLHQQL
jgi:hypothetical protein